MCLKLPHLTFNLLLYLNKNVRQVVPEVPRGAIKHHPSQMPDHTFLWLGKGEAESTAIWV